jgi:hypothetical protein
MLCYLFSRGALCVLVRSFLASEERLGIVGSHEGIGQREFPLPPVLLGREFVICHQMPLEHREVLPAFKTDQMVMADRLLHWHGRFVAWRSAWPALDRVRRTSFISRGSWSGVTSFPETCTETICPASSRIAELSAIASHLLLSLECSLDNRFSFSFGIQPKKRQQARKSTQNTGPLRIGWIICAQ